MNIPLQGDDPPPWPPSPGARALICARTLWWVIADASCVFWACRAPLLAVAVGGGLIAFTDQARDIVIAEVATGGGGTQELGASFFVAVWAITSWYWARATLSATFAIDPVDANGMLWRGLTAVERRLRACWRGFVVDQAPRVIGAAAIASLAAAFAKAASVYGAAGDMAHARTFGHSFWWYAGQVVTFYVLTAIRLPLTQHLFGQGGAIVGQLAAGRAHFTRIADYFGNVFGVAFLLASLALSPVLTWRFIADPVATSDFLGGAVNAVLLGLATLVPVFSLVALVGKRTGLPLFAGILVWLAAGPWLFVDNHDVRKLADARGEPPARDRMEDVFVRWWTVNRAITQPLRPGAGPDGAGAVAAPPFIVVATAGGASRAAFWTAQVLGEIAAREDRFTDRLFMISGVSGGSLGATVFRSIVEADRRASGTAGLATVPQAAGRAAAFIERDFLGPAMAAGLYVDLPFRAALALPRSMMPDDRAAALEKAWEAAWRGSVGKDPKVGFAWSDGFAAVFAGAGEDGRRRPWPILVLNGTSVEKGKRILTSNVDLGGGLSSEINRYDAFRILGADMRISTAVSMSARFPVISPTGGMRDATDTPRMRVIDGGLFENFGAATIDEVLRYVLERRPDGGPVQQPVVPIAILISSDPSLDHLDRITGTGDRRLPAGSRQPTPDCAPVTGPPAEAAPTPGPVPGSRWPQCPIDPNASASVIVDPVLALYDGRVARGEQAATTMLDRVSENRAGVVEQIATLLALPDDRVPSGVPGAPTDDDRAPSGVHGAPTDTAAARQQVREAVAARLGLGRRQHIDFFHFRQCRIAGRKGPTMSWHDSADAWSAMRAMTGLQGDDDPCGNAAEFFRLCVRLAVLSGRAGNDRLATESCRQPGRWRQPDDWACATRGEQHYCNLRHRVDRWLEARD